MIGKPRGDRWAHLTRRPFIKPRDVPLSPALRLRGDDVHRFRSLDPLARDERTALVEAILFLADEPLPARKVATAAGLGDAATARRAIRKLQQLLDEDGAAFQVEELAGGFQLLTRSEYHRWLASLRRGTQELKLSTAARETLAIIAYRQPLTRADIEAIRGVHCAETLRLLMERGLVKIAGRDDSLGRPVLYGTSKKFLQCFGLRSLKDLPRNDQLARRETTDDVAE